MEPANTVKLTRSRLKQIILEELLKDGIEFESSSRWIKPIERAVERAPKSAIARWAALANAACRLHPWVCVIVAAIGAAVVGYLIWKEGDDYNEADDPAVGIAGYILYLHNKDGKEIKWFETKEERDKWQKEYHRLKTQKGTGGGFFDISLLPQAHKLPAATPKRPEHMKTTKIWHKSPETDEEWARFYEDLVTLLGEDAIEDYLPRHGTDKKWGAEHKTALKAMQEKQFENFES